MVQFSKNTLKLLKFFYSRPDREFYIQELGRLLKTKPGVFQRALYKLEKEGVLQSFYRANARYFAANKNHRFYNELKSIIAKTANALVLLAVLNLSLINLPGFCEVKEPEALVLASLKDTIKLAYKSNKDIHIQEYAVKAAEANVVLARSAFLPDVNLNAGFTHNGAVLYSNAGEGKKDKRIFSGFRNDIMTGVGVNETIYSGGANMANYRQSQLSLKEQLETLRATKLNVELQAKQLYYGLLLAYETERIARDLVDQAQSHYEEVLKKYKEGTASRFDVLQSKVQVSLLLPQLINAENAIDLIAAEMDKLLGIKVGNKITITDQLVYAPIRIQEEDFLKEAYLNEPGMILKSLDIDINKWQIKYARAGWLPQVEATGQYTYNANNVSRLFNNRYNNWNVGLTVRLAVFDGFATKAKVDAARANYLQSTVIKENFADQVAVNVKQFCLDLIDASSTVKAQEDNLEDAKEALKISYVRYNNGVGINLDVLDAQVALANVQQYLAQGIYDYLMAQANLDRTMGKAVVEEGK